MVGKATGRYPRQTGELSNLLSDRDFDTPQHPVDSPHQPVQEMKRTKIRSTPAKDVEAA